jgi:putative transposase
VFGRLVWMGQTGFVDATLSSSYKGHRYPVEIISHCVAVSPLSAECAGDRGTDARARCPGHLRVDPSVVPHIRSGLRQRAASAAAPTGRQVASGRGVHHDQGQTHYLWRAVDQNGNVLDILVTSHRDATAATRFFRKLLTGLRSVPRVLVTDKLASSGVAHRRLMPSVEHRRSKYLNNRAENVPSTDPAAGTGP